MRVMSALVLTLALFSCMTANSAATDIRDRDWTHTSSSNATIRFGSDGRMSANTGCNSASADYTLTGDALSIGMMAMTKRACVDPGRNEFESDYVEALSKVKRYRVTSGQLELLDAGGNVLARFR